MTRRNRREFLRGVAAAAGLVGVSALPRVIRDALAVEPYRATGTIQDVAHIVVLTQENRSFDHYFGAMRGVRGFADRFPIPVEGGVSAPHHVLQQPRVGRDALPTPLQPFHLDTRGNFALMRAEGTPHSWLDAQQAWDHGRMGRWTQAKGEHAMGYYAQGDLPFHYALADAFTVCDAYHCSFQGGTNTNRLFLWTGTNDPHAQGNGPATYNDLDTLPAKPGVPAYTWTTYPQRLQAAGISWQIYQDMADNYDDNPLVGFQAFRDAAANPSGAAAELKARALSTRDLGQLKADVLANKLPQVSWIVSDAKGSEHPERSSPAQGADYTARVLEALTANPRVWSRTVLILNFDENDGFFDHVPPPAAPSVLRWDAGLARRELAGASTVDTRGEYHEHLVAYHSAEQEQALLHRVYGLGPRVPMLVISPWSRGGWVNSQVFDHTSVIRFMEQRFGVMEPSISPWRRAVCGDLTSTLDFGQARHDALPVWPATSALAAQAHALPQRIHPVVPTDSVPPVQAPGTRPSRALPYELHVHGMVRSAEPALELVFANTGAAAAVFHVYDRLNLSHMPRRYTVEPGKQLEDKWLLAAQDGGYDLWVLGPNGFHRHFTGRAAAPSKQRPDPEIEVGYDVAQRQLILRLRNAGAVACTFELRSNRYGRTPPLRLRVAPRGEVQRVLPIRRNGHWYDFTVRVAGLGGFVRRFAGRMETGMPSISDPAAASGSRAHG